MDNRVARMVVPYITFHRRTILKGVFFTIGVKTTYCAVFEQNFDSHGSFSQNIIRAIRTKFSKIRMIICILGRFYNNEPNNIRYFAWLADGNDAVIWMCI